MSYSVKEEERETVREGERSEFINFCHFLLFRGHAVPSHKNSTKLNQKNVTSTSESTWAVVVAQLVERSLAIPKVCSSNPVISKLLYRTFVYCIVKTKIKKKRS